MTERRQEGVDFLADFVGQKSPFLRSEGGVRVSVDSTDTLVRTICSRRVQAGHFGRSAQKQRGVEKVTPQGVLPKMAQNEPFWAK